MAAVGLSFSPKSMLGWIEEMMLLWWVRDWEELREVL
jgi:hypothetical protein